MYTSALPWDSLHQSSLVEVLAFKQRSSHLHGALGADPYRFSIDVHLYRKEMFTMNPWTTFQGNITKNQGQDSPNQRRCEDKRRSSLFAVTTFMFEPLKTSDHIFPVQPIPQKTYQKYIIYPTMPNVRPFHRSMAIF